MFVTVFVCLWQTKRWGGGLIGWRGLCVCVCMCVFGEEGAGAGGGGGG